jgi:hypothetical protein
MPHLAVLAVLLLALFALFLNGCVSINYDGFIAGAGVAGEGEKEAFTFDVGDLTEVRVGMYCDIVYNAAHSGVATLEIQPNLMEYVTVDVESDGSVLIIRSSRSINTQSGYSPTLTIGAPNLSYVSISGAGNFTTNDTIAGDSFTLEISGAGKGKAELDVGSFRLDMSGAGDFELIGRADVAALIMSGAGSIEALGLETREASIDMSGSGNVRVACSEKLTIDASGFGSVAYKGSPSIDLDRSGMVSVNRVE